MTHRWDEDLRREVPIDDELIQRVADGYKDQWIAIEKCPHYWKVAVNDDLY